MFFWDRTNYFFDNEEQIIRHNEEQGESGILQTLLVRKSWVDGGTGQDLFD